MVLPLVCGIAPQADKLNSNHVTSEHFHLNAHCRFTLYKIELPTSPQKPISSPILMITINPSQKLFILITEGPAIL